MSAQHTPTPWQIAGTHSAARQGWLDIIDSDGRTKPYTLTARTKTEANAAFIVRAVNSHDKLLAALEWIERIATANLEQDEKLRAQGARTLNRIADHAAAAIAEAKGEA